jgi:hypothetical protein
LRELLAVPDPAAQLTPDEVAVALAERELEAARAEGVLLAWECGVHDGSGDEYAEYLWFMGEETNKSCGSLNRPTRLAAATAAVAEVRRLWAEAEAKRLPDVGSMGRGQMICELHQRGWSEGYNPAGIPCWNGPSTQYSEVCGENWTGTTRRALRRARELDGE